MILELVKSIKILLNEAKNIQPIFIRSHLENLGHHLLYIESLAIVEKPTLPSVTMRNILLGSIIFHSKKIIKDIRKSNKMFFELENIFIFHDFKNLIWGCFFEDHDNLPLEDNVNKFKIFRKLCFSQYELFYQYQWAIDGLSLKNNLLILPEKEDFLFKLQFNTMHVLNTMKSSVNFKKLIEVLNYLDIFVYNKAIKHNISLNPIQNVILRRACVAKYAFEIIQDNLPDIIQTYALCINDLNSFFSIVFNLDNFPVPIDNIDNIDNINNSHAVLFQNVKNMPVFIKKETETETEITSRLYDLNMSSEKVENPDKLIYSFSFK
jgi:hypothetical protein